MGQDSKLSDVGKNVWAEDGEERKKVEQNVYDTLTLEQKYQSIYRR